MKVRTSADCPLVRLSLDNRSKEPESDSWVCRVVSGVFAREQAILEIGHDPRALLMVHESVELQNSNGQIIKYICPTRVTYAARASAPTSIIAKVNSLHMAVAIIVIIGLRIAVVEATGAVVVCPVEDCVHTLRFVASSYAGSGIVAIADAGRNVNTVRLLTVQCDLG